MEGLSEQASNLRKLIDSLQLVLSIPNRTSTESEYNAAFLAERSKIVVVLKRLRHEELPAAREVSIRPTYAGSIQSVLQAIKEAEAALDPVLDRMDVTQKEIDEVISGGDSPQN